MKSKEILNYGNIPSQQSPSVGGLDHYHQGTQSELSLCFMHLSTVQQDYQDPCMSPIAGKTHCNRSVPLWTLVVRLMQDPPLLLFPLTFVKHLSMCEIMFLTLKAIFPVTATMAFRLGCRLLQLIYLCRHTVMA